MTLFTTEYQLLVFGVAMCDWDESLVELANLSDISLPFSMQGTRQVQEILYLVANHMVPGGRFLPKTVVIEPRIQRSKMKPSAAEQTLPPFMFLCIVYFPHSEN